MHARSRLHDAAQNRIQMDLITALRKHDLDEVRRLHNRGVDPNGRDLQLVGVPLRAAINIGSIEAVEGLLRAGADPLLRDPTVDHPALTAVVMRAVELHRQGRAVTSDDERLDESDDDLDNGGRGWDSSHLGDILELLASYGGHAGQPSKPDVEPANAWALLREVPALMRAYRKGRASYESVLADVDAMLDEARGIGKA
ncbi:hypothetical protein SAMN05216466_106146 [Paraburkholderia phenazinium]|uniref:Uncharacterized protein n=1 Tax=Paraburkholderia phenazinium TaxID=60549 RepID=A0A1G7YFI3_9BURK|nr:hypothetical protein [Paraburkholderia phenazinium]SDG94640.1 hypothetical protein SAMN05216466_106146 [Paraburkholderia phenazinium]